MESTRLREAVQGFAAGFDAGALTADAVPVVLADVVAMRNMLGAVLISAAAVVAECDVWRATGAGTAAEQVASVTGSSVRAAGDVISTGTRVASQPIVAAAMRSGELSVDQASVIADAVAADASAESRLVELAGTSSLGEL